MRNISATQNTTPDISAIIEDAGNRIGKFDKGISKINSTRKLFTHDHKLKYVYLVVGKQPTESPLDNGEMLPLLAQPPYQYPPLVDAPDAPESPPPGPREDKSDDSHLASMGNLNGDILTSANDKLFGV